MGWGRGLAELWDGEEDWRSIWDGEGLGMGRITGRAFNTHYTEVNHPGMLKR